MMKQFVVLGIALMVLTGMAVSAGAAVDQNWVVQFVAYYNGDPGTVVSFGTKTGGNDAYTTVGGEDTALALPPGTLVTAEIISTIVPGQRTVKDMRAPYVSGSKIWDLSLYIIGPGSGTIRLDGWVAGGANQLNHSTDGDADLRVDLRQGQDVLWHVPYDSSGSVTNPQWSRTFAYNGEPIALQFGVFVPEPSSMIAMLSGLVGLVGYGIRRRK